ncbi:MAG TPA: type VI secretion protein IcmF/TssM N-terminal domain-containing protein [Gammaproteobacteria bacterium]|jgi:type VI secretion system protein ImpL|nr:type VI secretion protein IcmF/TssM N-terminal domain-containing protein [Gammaproteobacteria bacterium]
MKNIVQQITSNIKNYLAPLPALPQNPVLAKYAKNLGNHLYGAMQFLNNTTVNLARKKLKLNTLPWYLFIGSIAAGKTTFLANSGVRFILDKKMKSKNIQDIPPSETCDWWITPNAVIIDIPGHYVAYKEKMSSIPNKLWQHFLMLLQKKRGAAGLNGVIVAISLPELLNQQNDPKLASMLEYRLAELRQKFGAQLSFQFVITQCDLLPGFLEFFSDYSSEELSQAWGVPFPRLEKHDSLVDAFNSRFNVLIKRLNQQVLWRLHHEKNPHAKVYIKDFPLQLEHFKENMAGLLKILTKNEDTPFYLKGVYLTSAFQREQTEQQSQSTQLILASEQHALSIIQAPTAPVQAYFIKQFILQGLTS